jgi:hypothetical protein
MSTLPSFEMPSGACCHVEATGRFGIGGYARFVADVVVIERLFDESGAAGMVDVCERFGSYRMYAELEQLDSDIGRGLSQRQDALANFLRSGARQTTEAPQTLAARTSYFREEYAYGQHALISGIEPFLNHPTLIAAAQQVHGRPVVEPAIAYANLMVPGQELADTHRRSGVPRLQPKGHAAVAARRHAPLRLVRRLAAPDRDRHRVVPRL